AADYPQAPPMALEIKWPGNGVDDPKRERNRRLVLIGRVLLDDGKFVATQSREHVGFPGGGLQTFPDLNQQFVSGRVPQRIIDDLEFIEVDHHDGAGTSVPL